MPALNKTVKQAPEWLLKQEGVTKRQWKSRKRQELKGVLVALIVSMSRSSLSFTDRLRVLVTGKVEVETRIVAQNMAGSTRTKTIGFSEIDPYAGAVLKKHWPGVPNFGDVRNVPAIRCDVLTGGPPCQPASTAGKRKGQADDRWLWPQALRLVGQCRPTVCLFENPVGFVTLNGGVEFDQVLSSLEGLGYEIPPPLIVPACAVDAAHPRLRVWITAYSHGVRCDSGGDGRKRIHGRDTCGKIDAEITPDAERKHSPKEPKRNHKQPWTVADINCTRLERSITAKITQKVTRNGTTSLEPRLRFDPELLRGLHGLSNRVDRIRCLGNSIVPQVAQIFAKAIKAALT